MFRGAGHLFRPRYRKRGETRYKTSAVWWWKRGTLRLSTGCRDERDAEAWVLQRLAEMGRGSLVGLRASVLSYEDCTSMLRNAHALEQRRAPLSLKHLDAYFSGWKAAEITPEVVRGYAVKRRESGAAVATVNCELARLRRALRLAWQAGRLERQPVIPVLPGAKVRRGFVEEGDFRAILEHVPEKYRPPLVFLRHSGWRLMEALNLQWANVDRRAREVRLDTSKTGEPRCLPYGSHPDLSRLLGVLWRRRRGLVPWVFPGRAGRRLSKDCLERHWKAAREAAGYPGVLIHDLRRSWVRDAERAGVPRSVAMSITGHRSEEIYRRYAIAAVRDQREALEKMSQLAPRRKVARMRKRA